MIHLKLFEEFMPDRETDINRLRHELAKTPQKDEIEICEIKIGKIKAALSDAYKERSKREKTIELYLQNVIEPERHKRKNELYSRENITDIERKKLRERLRKYLNIKFRNFKANQKDKINNEIDELIDELRKVKNELARLLDIKQYRDNPAPISKEPNIGSDDPYYSKGLHMGPSRHSLNAHRGVKQPWSDAIPKQIKRVKR